MDILASHLKALAIALRKGMRHSIDLILRHLSQIICHQKFILTDRCTDAVKIGIAG